MAEPLPIKTLDLVLTSRCNLKCSYCFENDKKDLRMTWEIARAGMDRALASPRDEVDLVFFGGEPTLEFPLLRRCVAYARENARKGQHVAFSIITNGTTLGEPEIDFLAAHDVDTTISFDGVPQAQAFRGKGTFDRLDALLTGLRASHPAFWETRVSVSITLHPRMVRFFADSIRYFLGKGVPRIDVSPRITHDPSWKTEDIEILDAAFHEVYRASLRHLRAHGNVPLVIFRRSADELRVRPRSISMCGVGSGEKLAVDVDGQAHGCILFVDSYQKLPSPFLEERFASMRMGDVRDPAFEGRRRQYTEAATQAAIFDDKQRKYSSYGRCGACRYLATCSVCPTGIGHIPGNTDPDRVPDFACAYNLVALEYRRRFPRPGTARFDLKQGRRDAEIRKLVAAVKADRKSALARGRSRWD
ncbi:MAG TPA: radical SAM protein [Candidatus Polarisedimenticolaceae bacterium]|nr:radical SAM protein [Candidatus Polarisedimenticolaceae bacterium]